MHRHKPEHEIIAELEQFKQTVNQFESTTRCGYVKEENAGNFYHLIYEGEAVPSPVQQAIFWPYSTISYIRPTEEVKIKLSIDHK